MTWPGLDEHVRAGGVVRGVGDQHRRGDLVDALGELRAVVEAAHRDRHHAGLPAAQHGDDELGRVRQVDRDPAAARAAARRRSATSAAAASSPAQVQVRPSSWTRPRAVGSRQCSALEVRCEMGIHLPPPIPGGRARSGGRPPFHARREVHGAVQGLVALQPHEVRLGLGQRQASTGRCDRASGRDQDRRLATCQAVSPGSALDAGGRSPELSLVVLPAARATRAAHVGERSLVTGRARRRRGARPSPSEARKSASGSPGSAGWTPTPGVIRDSTWSPVKSSRCSSSYRHRWPGEWPGVQTARRRQPGRSSAGRRRPGWSRRPRTSPGRRPGHRSTPRARRAGCPSAGTLRRAAAT